VCVCVCVCVCGVNKSTVCTKFRAFLDYLHKYSPLSALCRVKLHQVQCRIKLYSSFRRSRSNVESRLTTFSAVPGPLSSHARQRFPLFQVNVKSRLTTFSAVPGPMSSQARQRFPLLQVQCRVTLDSTSVVPVRMSGHA